MNGDSIDSSRSPSPGSHGGRAKRQRLEASVSSSFNTSSNDSGLRSDRESTQLRELSVLRKRLSHTEAAAVQHRKIRNQIEELCEKEKNILELQVQMERETIEQLQRDLEIALRTIREAREAQAAAEAKLLRVQTTMEQRITVLSLENAKLKGNENNSKARRTSSKNPKNDEGTKEEISSEDENLIELERTNNENLISQEELNPQDIEVKDVRVVVQRFHPEVPSSEGQEMVETKGKRVNKSQEVTSPPRKTVQPKRSHKKRPSATKRKSAVGKKVDEPVAEQEEKGDNTSSKSRKSRSRTSSSVQPEAIFTQKTEELECQADVPQNDGDTFHRRSQRVKKVAGGITKTNKEPDIDQDDPLDTSDHEDVASQISKEYDPYPESNDVNDPLALISDDNEPNDNNDSASEASGDESSHSNHHEDFEAEDHHSTLNPTGLNDRESSIDKPNQDLRIRVGKHCFVLPSNGKFHELDWSEEFFLIRSREWECKKCSIIIKSKRQRMEDHVWVTHYGGNFTCLHCSPFHPLFTSRESIFNHMERKHSHLLPAENESVTEATD